MSGSVFPFVYMQFVLFEIHDSLQGFGAELRSGAVPTTAPAAGRELNYGSMFCLIKSIQKNKFLRVKEPSEILGSGFNALSRVLVRAQR